MSSFNSIAAKRIAQIINLSEEEIVGMLVKPPKPEMGDIGFPCFTLAKALKKAPPQIAAELAGKVEQGAPFSEAKAVGPYLNFIIDESAVAASTVGAALASPENWGKSESGKGKTMVIDYGSPNIAKPLAIHHMRTNVIGAALMRIYKATGWNVVAINHLGDWGTTFGQLMVSYKKAEAENPDQPVDVDALFKLYVKFHADMEADENLGNEARDWFKKLEDGDEEAKRLWKSFVDASMKPLYKIYGRLGMHFDHYLGESYFEDKMEATVENIKARNLLKESEGAMVIDLEEYGMPPLLVQKRDGATTYATRDLAAAEYRHKEFSFDKCLYVVANQQELHFRQVFKALELMGYDWANGCEHIKFGMLSLGPGVFGENNGEAITGSTRKGVVIFLADVLDRAVEKAKEILLDNARSESVKANVDTLAEQIGVGAVMFTEFMQRRMKDITFTWDRALNQQGDSGVYLQYTHARLSSIIRKYGKALPKEIDLSKLETDFERAVMMKVGQFPAAVEQAAKENEPSIVASYLLELCAVFNRMYTDKERHKIISEDEILSAARVGLVESVRITLANGLALLGLAAPEEM
ncbi:MAG: arginine--tRNA ligase [Planctomycetes bacterium]|nr:arginine--tRNA ligase [Planctomycetota bacterium]